MPVEGRALKAPDLDALWLVRVIDRGADGASAPRLVSLVIDDASLAVRWTSDVD